jgi:hypothetical protein
VLLAVVAALVAVAAPPVVLIEDVVYKADGTKFAGTAEISWPTFQTSDASYVVSHTLTVRIIDGILRVRLAPTAGATPNVTYTVRYQSNGRSASVESWAVPSSTTKLRVKDVRVVRTAGTPSTPPPNPAPTNVQMSDVVGLTEALSSRPVRGLTYLSSRAVASDENGALITVVGAAEDCVRADGTIGPCGSATSVPVFVDLETPAGTINGVNMIFTLSGAPLPAESLHLYRNGVLQRAGVDFNVTGSTVTFLSVSTPQSGDILQTSYRITP